MSLKTPNHSPTHHSFPPDIDLSHAIRTPYSIGQPDRTLDVVLGPEDRRIYWEASPSDEALKPYAGWEGLIEADEHGNEFLHVPTNARRASTILGGVEAWDGEKSEVISVISRYISRVGINLHGADVALSLDTIGVERGNYLMFAAPPHQLESDPAVVRGWAEELYEDTERILSMDPRREELLGSVRSALSKLSEQGLL